jgi:predicted nucleotide-binding protein
LEAGRVARQGQGESSVKITLRLKQEEVIQLHDAIIKGKPQGLSILDAKIVSKQLRTSAKINRPKVFIGSSSEGLSIAEAIQVNLDNICEVTLWNQGIFKVGQNILESLVNSLSSFDFAILIFTPDDMIRSRKRSLNSPRDNVLIELGLFIGHLGRERTFAVYDRTAEIKIPSDMAGVTPATFQPHSNGNLQASLGVASTKLKMAIEKLGPRVR